MTIRTTPGLLAVVGLSLMLTACGGEVAASGPTDEEMKAAITSACEDAVKGNAKYPREAEMIDPISGAIEDAEEGQGPATTTKVSVNFGVVAFSNAFGVKSDYRYGCVAYLDDEGTVLDTQVLTKEDNNVLSGIAYSPSEDRLL